MELDETDAGTRSGDFDVFVSLGLCSGGILVSEREGEFAEVGGCGAEFGCQHLEGGFVSRVVWVLGELSSRTVNV